MKELTQIIEGDFEKVGQALKGTLRGVVQGAYTPFFMTTGIRQFVDEIFRKDKSGIEIVTKDLAQLLSLFPLAYIIHLSISYQNYPKYLGILATTNVIDYFINTYRRSRKN